MPFFTLKGDLVSMNVDCIVNASNVKLSMVEGVSRAIFHRAGDLELSRICKQIGGCEVGDAVITPSFHLTNTKALIHAVAPIYINGKHDEEKNLIKVYRRCLELAIENNFNSIAFPLLSGEFNYPLLDCYLVACKVIKEFEKKHPNFFVYMVMYRNFPEMFNEEDRNRLTNFIIGNKGNKVDIRTKKTFVNVVKKYIKESGKSIEELAAKANMTTDTFNKLLDPQFDEFILKEHILSLAFAFDLSLEQLCELLAIKKFKFDYGNLLDGIVAYFLENNNHDIYRVNSVNFQNNIKQLGNNLF